MGSFPGHALPGTCFYLFGIWQLINAFYYYIKYNGSQINNCKKNVLAHSFRCCCSKNHKPLEGIVKISCCCLGMIVEGFGFIWGIPAMYQHFTMYAFFGFAGIVDILLYYDYSIPIKFDYCVHALSFFVEGMLFAFHVHGRTQLDIVLHTLLVYVCYFDAAVVMFMMLFSKQLIFKVLFSIGLMVQGSWFWQVGVILYPIINAKWCETCQKEVMRATTMFCWHLFLNSLLSIIIYSIMNRYVKPIENKSTARYEHLENDQEFDLEEQNSELLLKSKTSLNDSFL